ncbi:unnamed protein product, partial [Cuscuta europaea]
MVLPQGHLPLDHILDFPYAVRWACQHDWQQTNRFSLRVYRDQLDRMTEDEFEWIPYPLMNLPAYCHDANDLWAAEVPLIYTRFSEAHYPRRFCRQFNAYQDRPAPVVAGHRHHNSGSRFMVELVEEWALRWNKIFPLQWVDEGPFISDEYREWYRNVGKQWLTNPCVDRPTQGFVPAHPQAAIAIQCLGEIIRRLRVRDDPDDIIAHGVECLTRLGAEEAIDHDIITYEAADVDPLTALRPPRPHRGRGGPTRGRRIGRGNVRMGDVGTHDDAHLHSQSSRASSYHPSPVHQPHVYSTPTSPNIPIFDAGPSFFHSPVDWMIGLFGSETAGPSTQPTVEV